MQIEGSSSHQQQYQLRMPSCYTDATLSFLHICASIGAALYIQQTKSLPCYVNTGD